MQSRDGLTAQLIDVLQLEARALDQMQRAMGENRSAFVTVGARALTTSLQDLEPHWQVLDRLEERREGILGEICSAIQFDGPIRVSRLAAALPPHLARRLRAAAEAADAAARRIRAETKACARLLRASQQAHDEMIRALTACADREHTNYDKTARTTGSSATAGRLVHGTA